jgi:hypothetical protein
MRDLQPAAADLDPIAADLLTELAQRGNAAQVVVGGGVALKFFVDFRQTHDLDVWWLGEPTPEAFRSIEETVQAVASRRGFEVRVRKGSEVLSYDFEADGNRKFSFQIAPRDRWLGGVIDSPFPPVPVESFSDNIASKMTALVERCAPRDLVDVYEVVRRKLVSVQECWALWKQKHPGLDVNDAKATFAKKLAELIARTPVERFAPSEREQALERRRFFEGLFLKA